MNKADAMQILKWTAASPKRMEAFEGLARKLGVPRATVYHWWWKRSVPHWRLAAFDKLTKKRRAAA